jgi:type II secretory pathway pseudopilin PulG
LSDIEIGLGVGVLTFACGFFGMLLQKRLPEAHMSSGARDMIGAVMGLIALLLALVLGTLVGSAYGFYASQKANVEVLAARSIQLDMALRQFGPEANPMRAGLKDALAQAYTAIWVDNLDPRGYDINQLVATFNQLNLGTAQLQPKTPDQISAMPTINISVGVIEQTRLLMSLQLASPISWPLLGVVVSWAMLLFAGYGVLARLNGTAVMAACIGAFAVGSAVLLILQLNQPFSGLFRMPGASMEQALSVVDK